MNDKSFLVFGHHGACYGVDASLIREILALPELTPALESPGYIVGLFNLRGKIVPVMDLDLRTGRTPRPYRLSDNVIILEWQSALQGLLVNEVHDVLSIPDAAVEAPPTYVQDQDQPAPPSFFTGVAKSDLGLIMLLDPETLWGIPPTAEAKAAEETSAAAESRPLLFPEASPAERAIFRERARNYSQPIASQDFAGLVPMAVVKIGRECFGFNLQHVREFAEVQAITPIPCCPQHIVGDMNLRGDILTIVDIRGILQLPTSGRPPMGKIVAVRMGEMLVGVPVDEVLEIIYLRPSDMTSLPAAVHSTGDNHINGLAPYGQKMLSILDLPRILTSETLIVNEKVV
ncbi:MAG: chemotaxis protein CheW [Anaerolineae bacterium]